MTDSLRFAHGVERTDGVDVGMNARLHSRREGLMRSVMGTPALAALAGLLCACATTPPTTSYDKSASKIRGIAIQPPGLPEQAIVQTLGDTETRFSFANFPGMGNDNAEGRAAAAKDLQEIFAKTNYDYKKDLRESLQSALSKSGLPAFTVRGERPIKERTKFLSECPSVPGVDTCLDVFVTFVGFTAADAATDYVPTLELSAKLIRIADNATLFHDHIIYNAAAGTQGILAQTSGKYRFQDRDAMKANPQAVTAAVQEAVRSVASTLAKQFQ
jgi:hypothetical protein